MSANANVQSDPAPEARPSLTLKKRLKASPARVYAAWTDAAQMMQWFGPENVVMKEAECDPRVGGRFRAVMIENTGDRHEVGGIYRELVPNEKLVFSWSWITTPERESQVTVTLKADGDETILTLHHEQLFDEASRAGHEHGWTGSFNKLEKFFA